MKTKLIFFAILIMALASCQEETNPVKEQMLSEGWTLTGDTLGINLNVSVPSVVQTDLFDAGIIPDPYLGQVENDLLWVSDHPWKYTLHFNVNKEMLQSEFIDLIFEGIDTYADVVLNGQKLFHANNMFRSWTVPLRTVKVRPSKLYAIPSKRFIRFARLTMCWKSVFRVTTARCLRFTIRPCRVSLKNMP